MSNSGLFGGVKERIFDVQPWVVLFWHLGYFCVELIWCVLFSVYLVQNNLGTNLVPPRGHNHRDTSFQRVHNLAKEESVYTFRDISEDFVCTNGAQRKRWEKNLNKEQQKMYWEWYGVYRVLPWIQLFTILTCSLPTVECYSFLKVLEAQTKNLKAWKKVADGIEWPSTCPWLIAFTFSRAT